VGVYRGLREQGEKEGYGAKGERWAHRANRKKIDDSSSRYPLLAPLALCDKKPPYSLSL